MDGTPAQRIAYAAWLATRPRSIRRIARRFRPWRTYRLKTTGQTCSVYSFFEDGTISIMATGIFPGMAHNVFGVNPDDLEEINASEAQQRASVSFDDLLAIKARGDFEA